MKNAHALLILIGLLFGGRLDAKTLLFVGNSFTFGAGSKVMTFHPERVTDLNREEIGGVPALFATFAAEQGLDYTVSLETAPGKGLDYHFTQKHEMIVKPWDAVVLQTYSTLDADAPGNPAKLIDYAGKLTADLQALNPKARMYLTATWTRADQTFVKGTPWYGKPVYAMESDIEAACLKAQAATHQIDAVLPVGRAWYQAMTDRIADTNPYDGVGAGQVDLWAADHYHASEAGYYLEALVIFERVTGIDARRLGRDETAAKELGLTPELAAQFQAIAHQTVTTP